MFGRKQRAAQADRIAELEGRVAVMATTLRWYADPENWQRRATHQKGEPLKWEKSPTAYDRGERARSALVVAQPLRVGARAQLHPAKESAPARLVDRFISNAAGEPDDPLPTGEPMVIGPLSGRLEDLQWPRELAAQHAGAAPMEFRRIPVPGKQLASEDTE